MKDDRWIMTYSGIRFWPLDPDPELVSMEDIAHHLSNICRFTGACGFHYSVGQHSVLVSQAVREGHGLWGLLHDAGEAYLFDPAYPIKDSFPEVKRAERRILRVVAGKYGLPWPMPRAVRRADAAVAMAEWRVLMSASLTETRYAKVRPAQVPVARMSPEQAERWFLARFEELYEK